MNTLVTHGTAVMPEAAPVLRRKKSPLLLRIQTKLFSAWLRWRGVEFAGKQWLCGAMPVMRRDKQSRIVLGAGCIFGDGADICAMNGGTIAIGAGAFINGGIYATVGVTVGAHTKIAGGAAISDDSFHAVSPDSPAKKSKVRIGRNVWINPGVRICPGVTIGDHSVIGAGAVVTRDIPSRSLAAGVPARVVSTFECADDWVRG